MKKNLTKQEIEEHILKSIFLNKPFKITHAGYDDVYYVEIFYLKLTSHRLKIDLSFKYYENTLHEDSITSGWITRKVRNYINNFATLLNRTQDWDIKIGFIIPEKIPE